MSEIPTIGDVVREWRQYRQISLTEFSRQTTLSKGYISELEHKKIDNPKPAKLERLAAALGISVRDIVSRRMPNEVNSGAGQTVTPWQQASNPQLFSVAQAQQPPAATPADQALLRQILEQLQALTAKVSRVDSELTGLKQRVAIPSAGAKLIRRELEEQLHDKVPQLEVYGTLIVKAPQWEEEITTVEEQEGDLRLMMNGFQGMTVPPGQYAEQVRRVREQGRDKAKLMNNSIEHRKRRLAAFERQVIKEGNLFRHIMPIGALDWYRKWGFSSPDTWPYLLKGKPATPAQQAKHIRSVIRLLKKYDNYQIGLLTGKDPFFGQHHWEVKGGHTLLWEDFSQGERREEDRIVQDKSLVGFFCALFDHLWESDDVITDKTKVIDVLEKHAKSLEKSSAIS